MPESSPTLGADSTFAGKDLSPYWSDSIAAISSALWLPTGTAWRGSGLTSSSGWPSRTGARSWFSATRIRAPNGNSPRIFSPSCTPSVADCTDFAAAETRSRRIRAYPTAEQRRTLKLWFDAARWCYNETVARLREPGSVANWKATKTDIIHAAPERLQAAPYQVKSIAVRDACLAVRRCKQANKELAAAKNAGQRLDESFAVVKCRSRKHPRQGCFIPATAVSAHGVYYTILGDLRMAEPIPDEPKDSRLTLHNGQYHLSVPVKAQRRAGETQARVVALDPGIRSFLTWYSETDAGHIGRDDFGRIQRLCEHLDRLLGRAAKASGRSKRNMYRAASRMRVRVANLINELHHQAARFLVDNFDLILLPTFETPGYGPTR